MGEATDAISTFDIHGCGRDSAIGDSGEQPGERRQMVQMQWSFV